MSWLGRLLDRWINRPTEKAAAPARQLVVQPHMMSGLRAALGAKGAGWWASDHMEESLHFTGWNYVAIHAKAKAAMSASCRVVRKVQRKSAVLTKSHSPDHKAEEFVPLPEDHPAQLLMERPNPKDAGPVFRYRLSQQLNLTGSALIWVIRNQLGGIAELWVLPTGLARPMAADPNHPDGYYWVNTVGLFNASGFSRPAGAGVGQYSGFTVDARDVWAIRWPHPTMLADGQSPLAAGATQVDIADSLDDATGSSLKNEVRPGLFLSLDPSMNVDDNQLSQIEAKMTAMKAGALNTGKTIVIQGATPQQVTRSAIELDYVQGREQARNFVFGIHSTPPIAAGFQEPGAYAAYFAALKQSTELSIQPELDLIASALSQNIGRHYGSDIAVQIAASAIDDPDVIDRRRQVNAANKCTTINEDRATIGLPPVPWGDVQIGTVIEPARIDADMTEPGVQKPDAEPPEPAPDKPTTTKPPDVETEPDVSAKAWTATNRVAAYFANGHHKKFDEHKHPRADDGKFGEGSGGSKKPDKKPTKRPAKKPSSESGSQSAKKPAAAPRVAEQPMSDKAARAKAAHKMVDKEIQRYAEEHNEPAFAKAVGGVSFPDGEPIDVAIAGKDGRVAHAIELKTMVDNKNNKITMKRSAMERKAEWEKKNKAPIHTVVIDDHKVKDAKGPGKHDESKRRIFYRRGYGSFRVGTMHEVKDMAELKKIMAMPDADLPPAAMRPKGQSLGSLGKSFSEAIR